jgi:hypothetical protein
MLTRFKKITDYSPLTWYNKEAKETEPDNKSLIGGNPIIKWGGGGGGGRGGRGRGAG